jgi:hypothetical protein
MMFSNFEEVADEIFRMTHSGPERNPWTYGDAGLDSNTSREFYDIFTSIAPVDYVGEGWGYLSDTKVSAKSTPDYEHAWLRGYNWNYEGEPKIWELDFVFSYVDDEGFVKYTIEYKFYNNEDDFSVSAFIMECFETGYEGHQLEYGISLDHADKQLILSKIKGFTK